MEIRRAYLLWRRNRIDRALIRMSFRREALRLRREAVIRKLANLDAPVGCWTRRWAGR